MLSSATSDYTYSVLHNNLHIQFFFYSVLSTVRHQRHGIAWYESVPKHPLTVNIVVIIIVVVIIVIVVHRRRLRAAAQPKPMSQAASPS